jgi:hypothetical protein
METLQVVNVLDLDLPEDVYDRLTDHYEVSNGDYHRYYPQADWKYIKAEDKEIINAALIADGVIMSDIDYFHVLLYFSW